MGTTESLDQLAGILQRSEIAFERPEVGLFQIAYGSSAIFASARLAADEQTIIGMWSSVLVDLALDDERRIAALSAVNDLNRQSTTVRFVLYEESEKVGEIRAEHELLADDLQAAEAIHALSAVAEASDDNDERLKVLLGTGRAYRETQASDGEVVDT